MRKKDKGKALHRVAQKIARTVHEHRPSKNTLDSTNVKGKL